VANGCTEDEAKAAEEKIAKLIKQYNLTDEDLAEAEPEGTAVSEGSSEEWYAIRLSIGVQI